MVGPNGCVRRIWGARIITVFFSLVSMLVMFGRIDLGPLLGWSNPDYVRQVRLESTGARSSPSLLARH